MSSRRADDDYGWGQPQGSRGSGGRGSAEADADARVARIRATERRTRNALERSLMICAETEEIGASTLENLASQRETIERTHEKVKEVEHMNATSKWLLRGMSSFTGRVRNMFSKPPAPPEKKAPRSRGSRASAAGGAPTGTTARRRTPPSGSSASSAGRRASRDRRGGDSRGGGSSDKEPAWLAEGKRRDGVPPSSASSSGRSGRDRLFHNGTSTAAGSGGGGGGGGAGLAYDPAASRAAEDALLGELSNGIGRLHAMATATGRELDTQNKLLSDLGEDMDKAHAGMRKNNAKARRLT